MGRHNQPTWQEKCLMVIETICEHECIGPTRHLAKEKCLPCEIFRIAHVGTASCGHPEWDKEVEKYWKLFNDEKLI